MEARLSTAVPERGPGRARRPCRCSKSRINLRSRAWSRRSCSPNRGKRCDSGSSPNFATNDGLAERVWLKLDDVEADSWSPATLTSRTSDGVEVLADSGERRVVNRGCCRRTRRRTRRPTAQLVHLSELRLLHTLGSRYAAGEIYTYTGTLIASTRGQPPPTTPSRRALPAAAARPPRAPAPPLALTCTLPTPQVERYRGQPVCALPPHLYATADLLTGLQQDGDDQTILVSGESGAGKTESTKRPRVPRARRPALPAWPPHRPTDRRRLTHPSSAGGDERGVQRGRRRRGGCCSGSCCRRTRCSRRSATRGRCATTTRRASASSCRRTRATAPSSAAPSAPTCSRSREWWRRGRASATTTSSTRCSAASGWSASCSSCYLGQVRLPSSTGHRRADAAAPMAGARVRRRRAGAAA